MSSLEYLKQYGSERTPKTYMTGLRRFFEGDPRNVLEGQDISTLSGREGLEAVADRYIARLKAVGEDQENPWLAREEVNKAAQEDISKFLARIKEAAPKTIKLRMTTVRVFLEENAVEPPRTFWNRISKRRSGSKAITRDHVLTNEEIRSIVTHMDVRGKSFFMCLATSGMRLSEALQVTMDDIDMAKDPVRIDLRPAYTKKHERRDAFISREAKAALEEWLKVRDRYVQKDVEGVEDVDLSQRGEGICAQCGKGPFRNSRGLHSHMIRSHRPVDDGRVWAMSAANAQLIWRNAVEKVGLLEKDPDSGKNTCHIHCLRKFVRTKLGSVPSIAQDVAEALVGHEGYLTSEYRRHTTEALAEFYLKAEPVLAIFQDAEQLGKLRADLDKSVKDLEESKHDLEKLLAGVVMENAELRKEAAGMKGRIARLEEIARIGDEVGAEVADLSPEELVILSKLIGRLKRKD